MGQTFKLSKVREVILPTSPAYSQMVPIKAKRLLDMRTILLYTPTEHKGFYERVLGWDQSMPLHENAEDNSESESNE
ncbi:hypothetical protein J6590_042555 [Homalodisca vitripennis]|nr:hypothetical protein J6590_042555 [Homalodisca vitripennis]